MVRPKYLMARWSIYTRDFNRDLARLGHGLIVNVLVVQGDRRFFGGFSNIQADGSGARSFGYVMQELTKPLAFANGSGSARAMAAGHLDVLTKQLSVRPRRVHSHMKLLATVNRRVAKVENSVSPYCHVSFVNADDRYGPAHEVFVERGESVPFRMPMLLFGIDVSYVAEQLMRDFQAGEVPMAFDPDEVNQHLRRRP